MVSKHVFLTVTKQDSYVRYRIRHMIQTGVYIADNMNYICMKYMEEQT